MVTFKALQTPSGARPNRGSTVVQTEPG